MRAILQLGRRAARSSPALIVLAFSVISPAIAEDAAAVAARQSQRQSEYEMVARDMALSKENLDKLTTEIDLLKKDHGTITAALIQAAMTEKKLGQDIEDISDRLDTLRGQQTGIHRSLEARRDVLAEVLGALQRMGLNPPPALLVKPEDALSSVRSAILLGAVVPQLRSETEILLADLNELSRLTASIEAEHKRLSTTIAEQITEKQRLDLLLTEKTRLQSAQQIALAEEQHRAETLAARAGSLKDLIASLETEAASKRTAEERAARAGEAEKQRNAARAAMPVPEANRLLETAPFSRQRGKLVLPVVGQRSRRFGGKDSNGGVMLGDTVATHSSAIVTAPADGSVLYAGPFRSYGQLLILNAGDGYHVVLAGMARISVTTGQSVLAGEPVGAMGEAKVASAAATKNDSGPELYVEFRKDGKPVDPAPWWAVRVSGRT
ncbi:peptidoglycan DD-metalloendopeptidase family protein [Mesorhizobium sp. NBSH29]|uniref:murein hydrolase activator EnvC family protein n=1 Tax=Mesorhizobium sp. NBSH29 TaxID=2654249 RepID=UPI0018968EEB|nr:peptidoglycan DD-metalloendopeptidase family protein [Mesorhizobium sp. NBSH29]